GTVLVHFHCERQYSPRDFVINKLALRSYINEVRGVCAELGLLAQGEMLLGQVLSLPGVVPEPGLAPMALEEQWPPIERLLEEALGKLQTMRQEEGRAMGAELLQYRDFISGKLERIRQRAPGVVEAYRDRLHERVRKLLTDLDVEIDKSDLIKEV